MKTIRYALVRSLPIMAGYIVLGLGFGVLLQSKGYGAGWALVMSGLIYAGSMQYVAIDLLAGGASLISAAIMTLMVNARHLFYGISMLERYKDTGAAKPYLIFALTDETYSVVCSGGVPEGVDRKKYYFWVSLLNQLYWIAGGVAGALLGSVLPFDTTGIDFSMTALFLVVMTEQWKASRDHTPALVGLGVSLVCLLVFGSSDFLIPSMVGITAALTVLRGLCRKRRPTMPFDVHGALLVAVVAGVTALIRFLPFVVFGGGRPTPKFVVYLAGVLPCAIMAMLVVYCLRGVDLLGPTHGLPELLAGAAVVGLHLWKKNTLLSIAVGTALYMVLVQAVFV